MPPPVSPSSVEWTQIDFFNSDRTEANPSRSENPSIISSAPSCPTTKQGVIDQYSSSDLSEISCAANDEKFLVQKNSFLCWEEICSIFPDEVPSNLVPKNRIENISEDIRSFYVKRFNDWLEKHPDILSTVKKVCLSHKTLTDIPPEISLFPEVEELDLSHNNINHLGDIFDNLSKLRELNLSFNPIRSLPKSIAEKKGFEISALFHEEKSFFIFWEAIQKAIPDKVPDLLIPKGSFESMSFETRSFYISKIRTWIKSNNETLKNIETLDLSNSELTCLPEELFSLSGLYTLDISNNKISSLPDLFDVLADLETLDCSINPITELPETVKSHNLLDSSDIFSNENDFLLFWFSLKKSQPDLLSNLMLPSEKYDDLSSESRRECVNNIFTWIKRNKEEISKVESLDLSDCELSSLPEMVFLFDGLRELNIGNNLISDLPDHFDRLPFLKKLNCSFNPLKLLPATIRNHLELKKKMSFDEERSFYLFWNALCDANKDQIPQYLRFTIPFDRLSSDLLIHDIRLVRTWISENPNVFTSIESLDLSSLGLTSIPHEIFLCNNLQKLNLVGNRIENLPNHFDDLPNLKNLNCSLNPISSIPETIQSHPNLENADLFPDETNYFSFWAAIHESLPVSIPNYLVPQKDYKEPSFELKRVYFKKISQWIEKNHSAIAKVTSLDLSNRGLTALPEEIFLFTGLQKLDLSDNSFRALPDHFDRLPSLCGVNCSFNPIDPLPDSLTSLPQLMGHEFFPDEKNLLRFWNKVNDIPSLSLPTASLTNSSYEQSPFDSRYQYVKSIRSNLQTGSILQKLKKLDLSSCGLTAFPVEIFQCVNLEELNLRNNKIRQLPDQFNQLEKLAHFDCSLNPLKEFPPSLEANIKVAVVSEIGELQSFYAFIDKIRSSLVDVSPKNLFLQKPIEITSNSIKRLKMNDLQRHLKTEKAIEHLENIHTLDLSNSGLYTIPEEVFLCKNLKQLNLENNRLKKLPDLFKKLPNLEEINISHNQISKIPDSLWSCRKVEILNVNNNRISELSARVQSLSGLSTLDVSNNKIKTLPPTLALFTSLKLICANNSFDMEAEEDIYMTFYQMRHAIRTAGKAHLKTVPDKAFSNSIKKAPIPNNSHTVEVLPPPPARIQHTTTVTTTAKITDRSHPLWKGKSAKEMD